MISAPTYKRSLSLLSALVIGIIVWSVYCLLSSPVSYAADLTQASVRLGSNKVSTTNVEVLVLAKATTTDIESKVVVTIGTSTGFSVDSLASNILVTTTGVPSTYKGDSVTVWPGIGLAAVSVSGQDITFASSDLVVGTLYAFRITAGVSTTSSTGSYTFAINTKDGAGSSIDYKEVAVQTVSTDQVAITAQVPIDSIDLEAEIVSVTKGTIFTQEKNIRYRITYGSDVLYSIPLTIEAEWGLGTIEGNPSPSVEVLTFITGNATSAYGGAAPVIDLANRKITWTITSFPANTHNQTVEFTLQTLDSYQGWKPVSFSVSARVMTGSVITPDDSVSQIYKFRHDNDPNDKYSAPKLDEISKVPQEPFLGFIDISITDISQSQATIRVEASKMATLQVRYGTDSKNLKHSVSSFSPSGIYYIKLDNLIPDTSYYFVLELSDSSGKKVVSSLYTFRTAKISVSPEIVGNSMVLLSNNVILYHDPLATSKSPTPVIHIPIGAIYEVKLSLTNFEFIKDVKVVVRDSLVLGINSFTKPEPSSKMSFLEEITSGTFFGRLATGGRTGLFDLYLNVSDTKGNKSERRIARVQILEPFRVISNDSEKPVENARILLSIFNSRLKVFEVINQNSININNPTYSESNGDVLITLPSGIYRANISALGFEKSEVDFEIGEGLNSGYPQVELVRSNFSIVNLTKYYVTALTDTTNELKLNLKNLSTSTRFYDLMTLLVLLVLSLLCFSALSVRTRIPLHSIPSLLKYNILAILPIRSLGKPVRGYVADDLSGFVIEQVQVFLIDAVSNRIVLHTTTNNLGEFYFKIKGDDIKSFKIALLKKGYESSPLMEYSKESLLVAPLKYSLKRLSSPESNIFWIVSRMFSRFWGFLFEIFLTLSIFMEFLFIDSFGFLATLPFIAFSLGALCVWFVYILNRFRLRSEF